VEKDISRVQKATSPSSTPRKITFTIIQWHWAFCSYILSPSRRSWRKRREWSRRNQSAL